MNLSTWRYYAQFYRGHNRRLLFSSLASVGQSALVVPIALLVRRAIDVAIPAGDAGFLLVIGVAILGLHLLNSGLALWTRHVTLQTTKIAISRLREELILKLYTLPRARYSQADRSLWHTVIVQDTERVDNMSNTLLALFLPALITSAGLGLVLLFLDWFLFATLMCATPLLLVVSRSMGQRVRQHVNAFRHSFETFSKGVLFVLQGMDLTRTQAAEEWEVERQRGYLEELRVTSGAMAWLQAAYGLVQNALVMVSGVLILVVGGRAVMAGRMTIGDLLSFYVAVGLLNNSLKTVLNAIPPIIAGNESLQSLYDLLHVDAARPYAGTQQIAFAGKVALESVSFGYDDRPLLRNVDLTIEPHATVAIVGPNGAGKSTIIHLILGLYRPQHGAIYADDQPLSDLDLVHLRRQIGVVPQDPLIFGGTILENITYGAPEADLESVVRIAKLATAHEFIEPLPRGYATPVGEDGTLLSGGQRQRIALARALLRQPKLLILDEPTNHLDAASISVLMDNLRTLEHAPAILIVSHDATVVRYAERVYALQEGRLVASEQPATVPDGRDGQPRRRPANPRRMHEQPIS